MLTSDQLALLRQDLIILASIKYDEVTAELLDHYASLTEQHMANGLSFTDASKWAWAELGSGEGIQQIQTDFEKSISKRHVAIIKSYLGWPTIITTGLIATLVYVITPLMPLNSMKILMESFYLTPTLIMLYVYRTNLSNQPDRQKIFWLYLTKSFSVGYWLSFFWGFFLNDFNHKKSIDWLFQFHSTVGVFLCCLSLAYTISLLQLFKENFELKMPNLSPR